MYPAKKQHRLFCWFANPLLVFTGGLNEKLQNAIEGNLITRLTESKAITMLQEITDTTPAVCTVIFDREAYQPTCFMRLWTKYRIAVLTYQKNVKDKWEEESFKDQLITTGSNICCNRLLKVKGESEIRPGFCRFTFNINL